MARRYNETEPDNFRFPTTLPSLENLVICAGFSVISKVIRTVQMMLMSVPKIIPEVRLYVLQIKTSRIVIKH